jgi:hypothetical protein
VPLGRIAVFYPGRKWMIRNSVAGQTPTEMFDEFFLRISAA